MNVLYTAQAQSIGGGRNSVATRGNVAVTLEVV